MKRGLLAVVVLFSTLSVFGQSKEVSLDDAVKNSAFQIIDGLGRGSKIVVYQFQSDNPRVSGFVLKELFNWLVNSKKFTVLDRESQDVIKAERDFQYVQNAGMVSDESLMSLTKIIGAQAIVTGELVDYVTEYRFYVKVIGTETTEALLSFSGSVNKNDKRIRALRPKTTGDKIGTGALNILFGLGSYLEGDIAGGVTVTGGYALAAGLFVTEIFAIDWDSPMYGVPATVGFGVAGLTLVYGFARPFMYNRNPKAAAILDNARPKIVLVQDTYGNNNFGFQLAYTFKF